MNVATDFDSDESDFVEADPTGRYWRYNEILGKGSSKTVYRAFDEYEGIEVAWNQVKLCDFLHNPEDLERLYREIHLLKTLKHNNIMKFYTSWVDTDNRKINFVTEMFTSGTLRQYRLKHRRVDMRAIKNWCRQILQGLLYLHSHDPPIIHRDLKCDNIFINGNQGEVKIGDLGLAAILRNSHAARCVGTPEFMAPEVYEEEYNELVDVYSFGMCVLEMLTFEYPYSECHHPAQIYKKVISGKKPDALYKVQDPEVRRFLGKCLATVSHRHSAWELLNDPFLQIDETGLHLREPHYSHEDEHNPHPAEHEITIKGKRKEDGNFFLKIRIADIEGCVRNIYFPFDIETDTALSVATEMIAELDITDQDVTKIASLIDDEISSLVPEWKRGFALEASQSDIPAPHRHDKASGGRHSRRGSTIHGRFEEFTYKFDEAPAGSSQSDDTDLIAPIEADEEESSGSRSKMFDQNSEGVLSLQDLLIADDTSLEGKNNSVEDPISRSEEDKCQASGSNKQRKEGTKLASWALGKVFPAIPSKGKGRYDSESCNAVRMAAAQSFFSGTLLPFSSHLHFPSRRY